MIRFAALAFSAFAGLAQSGAAQDALHTSSFVMDAHVHVMTRSLLDGLDIVTGPRTGT